MHLRTCQQCGTTLCCDSSPNKHATKHFQASGHPVVASAEPGERWLWCYVDEQMAQY
ncbi:UBP-type zinc finger domain-containing protein [Spirosoma taeanense]|uniref:UBP-type zinc finger domain-containing protein n=1 Tax=Spirosoma taeanense TaxID=2735870 RepID=UPI001F035A46|nr:UBP-type zinc finger domain-containing protein [Spirosoma taeanense]